MGKLVSLTLQSLLFSLAVSEEVWVKFRHH